MIHFRRPVKPPGLLDKMLCVFAVALSAFGAGLFIRALYNAAF